MRSPNKCLYILQTERYFPQNLGGSSSICFSALWPPQVHLMYSKTGERTSDVCCGIAALRGIGYTEEPESPGNAREWTLHHPFSGSSVATPWRFPSSPTYLQKLHRVSTSLFLQLQHARWSQDCAEGTNLKHFKSVAHIYNLAAKVWVQLAHTWAVA